MCVKKSKEKTVAKEVPKQINYIRLHLDYDQ